MELTDKNTLQTVDQYTVVDCVPLPEKWMCKITLDHDLPDNTENLVLSDITRLPFVEITGCTARSHFARGVLLKTRGAVVENNYFLDIFGTAIQIAAEAAWSEGVCPADITIRHNFISNCGCDGWDVGGICVKRIARKAEVRVFFISRLRITSLIRPGPGAVFLSETLAG